MTRPARPAASGFARLAVATVIASLVLVALGGVVRATNSGLACPTWPGCFSAGDFVPARELSVWLEHSHRLLAGVVAIMIAAQLVWAIARYRHRPAILWPVVGAAVAVNLQALLGAVVVWNLLRAELVTAHLGLAMAIVALLLFVALESGRAAGPPPGDPRLRAFGRTFGRTALGVAALCYVQILVGGHVSGVGAGLAFVGDPLLGVAAVGPIEGEGEFFNVAHRLLAVALVVATGLLIRRARQAEVDGWLLRLPHVAAGLLVLQVLIGVGNLWSGLSFLTVVPHLAVASWIWALLVITTVLAYGAAVPETVGHAEARQLARSGR